MNQINTEIGGRAVRLTDYYVEIDGTKYLPPTSGNYGSVSIVNDEIFINGYQFVNGRWKRTLKALWHLLF